MKKMDNVRIVPCAACGGDGEFCTPWDIDRRDGSVIERVERCRYCNGTGDEFVQVQPIEMEDLDAQREAEAALVDAKYMPLSEYVRRWGAS